MKLKNIEQWGWTECIGFASALAVVGAALLHHGYFGYFGIKFWEYVSVQELATSSLGILLYLAASIAALLGVNAFAYHVVVKRTRASDDKKTRKSLDFYISNFFGAVILATVVWVSVRTFIKQPLFEQRLNVVATSLLMALPLVLSNASVFRWVSPNRFFRIEVIALVLGVVLLPPVQGYTAAYSLHMTAISPAYVRLECLYADFFKEPSRFSSKKGYVVIGQLKETLFLFDRAPARVMTVSAGEILRREQPLPLLPTTTLPWPL